MTKIDEAFAAELHRDLMQDAAGAVDRYLSADETNIKHDRWRAVVALVKGLSDAQREALQELITQQWVDAAASMFSVIEGVRLLDGFDQDELRLTYGAADIGRDSMTNFLTADERARPWVLG